MKLFLGVVFLILFYSCKNCFSRIEYENEIKWEKTYCSKKKYAVPVNDDSAIYIRESIDPILVKDQYVYQFDSVRVYVNENDTLLNKLLSLGFIRGENFFRKRRKEKGIPDLWPDLVKRNKNGWFGYHISLAGIYEINIDFSEIPYKHRKFWKQVRYFKIRVYLPTQIYYATPDLFRLELEHDVLSLKDVHLPIQKFLKNSKVIEFEYWGCEI